MSDDDKKAIDHSEPTYSGNITSSTLIQELFDDLSQKIQSKLTANLEASPLHQR